MPHVALCGPESAVPYLFGFVQLRESEALTRFQSIRSDCSTGQEKMQAPSVFVALASDREVKGKQPGRAYSETVTVFFSSDILDKSLACRSIATACAGVVGLQASAVWCLV